MESCKWDDGGSHPKTDTDKRRKKHQMMIKERAISPSSSTIINSPNEREVVKWWWWWWWWLSIGWEEEIKTIIKKRSGSSSPNLIVLTDSHVCLMSILIQHLWLWSLSGEIGGKLVNCERNRQFPVFVLGWEMKERNLERGRLIISRSLWVINHLRQPKSH